MLIAFWNQDSPSHPPQKVRVEKYWNASQGLSALLLKEFNREKRTGKDNFLKQTNNYLNFTPFLTHSQLMPDIQDKKSLAQPVKTWFH